MKLPKRKTANKFIKHVAVNFLKLRITFCKKSFWNLTSRCLLNFCRFLRKKIRLGTFYQGRSGKRKQTYTYTYTCTYTYIYIHIYIYIYLAYGISIVTYIIGGISTYILGQKIVYEFFCLILLHLSQNIYS